MKHFLKFSGLALLFVLITSFQGCLLTQTPKETLPPITQTGANTFGCYVNGKLWLPKGYKGTSSNLDLSYDPTFMGGAFNIGTYRVDNNLTQYIIIASDSLSKTGTYYLSPKGRFLCYYNIFDNNNKGCFYDDYSVVQRSGHITITRLDVQNAIAS